MFFNVAWCIAVTASVQFCASLMHKKWQELAKLGSSNLIVWLLWFIQMRFCSRIIVNKSIKIVYKSNSLDISSVIVDDSLIYLLFKNVHWSLVSFQLLIFEEDLPSELQRRWKQRLIRKITLKQEFGHQLLSKNSLKRKTYEQCSPSKDTDSSNEQLEHIHSVKIQTGTLKISAILRCCGKEQWFSMDRITGISEYTNAARLTASTTSYRPQECFSQQKTYIKST